MSNEAPVLSLGDLSKSTYNVFAHVQDNVEIKKSIYSEITSYYGLEFKQNFLPKEAKRPSNIKEVQRKSISTHSDEDILPPNQIYYI